MSEIATSTTVTESAPTSTAEAASQVIDSFESGNDDGIEVSGETPAAEPTTETPAADTPEPAKELSAEERDAEALLSEFGYKDARKPDGREHWMPRSKALKMIANGLRKGRDKWGTEKAPLESRVGELQGYLDNLAKGVSGDPRAFLSELAEIDPRYRSFLEQQAAEARQETPKAEDDPEPQPDYDLGNGSRTYSVEGIRKLREWERRQLQREIDNKLKPYAEREQREKARQAQETQLATLREKTTKAMSEAQTWPLFGQLPADGSLTPFQQEVLGALQADKALDLRGAYMKVALPRLMEDDTKKRERLLKEINAAPKSTAVTKGGAEIQRQTGPTTTADIAARALERLERGR